MSVCSPSWAATCDRTEGPLFCYYLVNHRCYFICLCSSDHRVAVTLISGPLLSPCWWGRPWEARCLACPAMGVLLGSRRRRHGEAPCNWVYLRGCLGGLGSQGRNTAAWSRLAGTSPAAPVSATRCICAHVCVRPQANNNSESFFLLDTSPFPVDGLRVFFWRELYFHQCFPVFFQRLFLSEFWFVFWSELRKKFVNYFSICLSLKLGPTFWRCLCFFVVLITFGW